jgi:hypothetical protein
MKKVALGAGTVVVFLTALPVNAESPTKGSFGTLSLAPQPDYLYEAMTRDPVKRDGSVVAGGIRWTCQGRKCTVIGPWPTPGVGSCRALAQVVGYIIDYKGSRLHRNPNGSRYPLPGKPLTPEQLSECNEGLQPPRGPGSATSTPSSPSCPACPQPAPNSRFGIVCTEGTVSEGTWEANRILDQQEIRVNFCGGTGYRQGGSGQPGGFQLCHYMLTPPFQASQLTVTPIAGGRYLFCFLVTGLKR